MWNILPTRSRIDVASHRRVLETSTCPLCADQLESLNHLFFDCKVSRPLWKEAPWPLLIERFADYPNVHWISIVLDPGIIGILVAEYHHFQLYAVNALDVVWFERNRIVHESCDCEMPLVLARRRRVTMHHVNAWQLRHQHLSHEWHPPDPGVIKINVDVAIRPSYAMAACVCRHFQGLFLETKLLDVVDPLVGEVEALWLGVHIAARMGWSQVILEEDSLIVMDSVGRDIADCPWKIEHLISRIQSLLNSSPSYRSVFSPRSTNVAVYSLSQWAASSLKDECFPEFHGHHLWFLGFMRAFSLLRRDFLVLACIFCLFCLVSFCLDSVFYVNSSGFVD